MRNMSSDSEPEIRFTYRASRHTQRIKTMTTTPIPFYVLCGALGAGKTTLLMRLLEYWKSQGKTSRRVDERSR